MSKDLASKMHLKMKLYTHKLQEGGSVLNHLTVFKEIVSHLEAMEVDYDDEDFPILQYARINHPLSLPATL